MSNLIQLGWVNSQGQPLTWRDCQKKRIAVSYWRNPETRKLQPIYDAQPSQVKVRRDAAPTQAQ
jgi:hypothetical protein